MSKIFSLIFSVILFVLATILIVYHAVMGHIHGVGWFVCLIFLTLLFNLFRLTIKEFKED